MPRSASSMSRSCSRSATAPASWASASASWLASLAGRRKQGKAGTGRDAGETGRQRTVPCRPHGTTTTSPAAPSALLPAPPRAPVPLAAQPLQARLDLSQVALQPAQHALKGVSHHALLVLQRPHLRARSGERRTHGEWCIGLVLPAAKKWGQERQPSRERRKRQRHLHPHPMISCTSIPSAARTRQASVSARSACTVSSSLSDTTSLVSWEVREAEPRAGEPEPAAEAPPLQALQ